MVKRKVNFSMLCLLDGVFPIPISTIVPPRENPIGASRWAWLTLCAVTALLTCVMLCRVAKKRKQLTHVICTAIAEQFAAVVLLFVFIFCRTAVASNEDEDAAVATATAATVDACYRCCWLLVAVRLRLLHELVKRESRSLVWPAVSRSDWQSNSWASRSSR